ncbi:hypothetical protein LJC08_04180, partial [Methanimicrococcus sp. OttesenSCG-928-J09]|nr:hypothetical protein [Methanimicrococcus sp. OttesenSCG-928-J09]
PHAREPPHFSKIYEKGHTIFLTFQTDKMFMCQIGVPSFINYSDDNDKHTDDTGSAVEARSNDGRLPVRKRSGRCLV